MAAASLLLFVVSIFINGPAHGHAGHDDIPSAAPAMGDVPPRYYALGETADVVLVVPNKSDATSPTLYLSHHATNAPIAVASITAEVLSGTSKVEVAPAMSPGVYYVSGLPDDGSTVSLLLDISAGPILEILTMDGVGVGAGGEHGEVAAEAAAAGNSRIWIALLLLNLLIGGVVAWAAIFTSLGRRGPRQGASIVILVMLCGRAFGHAGDDHAGVPLTGTTAAGQHFVAKPTQFSADIQTTEAVRIPMVRVFRALGRVEVRSDRRAIVTPPAEGRLAVIGEGRTRVPVTGDTVAEGQTLVMLQRVIPAGDAASLASERAEVEGDLLQARQERELALREKERAEQLKDVISASEVDRTVTQYKVAEERVAGREARLVALTDALAGRGLGTQEVPIDAPLTGSVTRSHAVIGEYVRPEKELFEIVNTDEVFVRAAVFESDLARVTSATRARITLEAYPGESFDGELHAIGSEADMDTRSVPVTFNVRNHDARLRGGMFANVEIEVGEPRPVIAVPRSAVVTVSGIRHVFVKTGPEVFEARPVEVEQYRDDLAALSSGLSLGDAVAVSGLYQIRMSPAPAPLD